MAEEFGSGEPAGKMIMNGRWVLEGHLEGADSGGGGVVWRAYRLGSPGAPFVVKMVPSALADKRTRRYIQQLGIRHEQRASRVVSDHIGKIIDHGDDQGLLLPCLPAVPAGQPLEVLRVDRVTSGPSAGAPRSSTRSCPG